MESRNKRGKKRGAGGIFLPALGKGVLLGLGITWLFFDGLLGLVCMPFCVAFVWMREKRNRMQKQQEKNQELFAEYLGFLKEALLVGYSLEQAVTEGKKGMLTAGREEDPFLQCVSRMERKMQLGMPVEAAFAEWAQEAKCEDIRDFSEVLFIAKRTGGVVQQVIDNTERVIREKQETLRYIRSVLHSREYEAKVMKLMPFVMLLYLRLFMPEYLEPLYHNPAGVFIMSAVLAGYGVLCLVSDRVTKVSL